MRHFGNSPGTGRANTGIANGSFGLWCGVPYAMVAKLAHPDKKVTLLTGVVLLAMELWNMIPLRYGIKFTTLSSMTAAGNDQEVRSPEATEDKPFVLIVPKRCSLRLWWKPGRTWRICDRAAEIGAAIDRAMFL